METRDLINISQPSQFLVDNLDLLPRGQVLDLAMGYGRNAIFLASCGFEVEGVDISAVAVEEAKKFAIKANVNIKAHIADLETTYKIKESTYDLIICFNYLQRSLMQAIKNGIVKGGFVIYETYTIDQPKYGKPHNTEYLLNYNELLAIFREFRCLRYREGVIKGGKGPEAKASILAQKVNP